MRVIRLAAEATGYVASGYLVVGLVRVAPSLPPWPLDSAGSVLQLLSYLAYATLIWPWL